MPGLIDRFHTSVTKVESGCWEVPATARGGYGKIKFMGKTILFHRLSYELFNGPIPDGMMVCHQCDNPRCVNPNHLFLGTALDNMQDKVIKGRHKGAAKGAAHHKAKLTLWQVDEIRKRLAEGDLQGSIASDYGVSQTVISNIKTGKRWGNPNAKRR